MKVKDLIDELKDCDPECEVNVGGRMILFVEQLPAYYDGELHVRTEDGVKLVRNGHDKVLLRTYDWEDLLCDYPDAVIDVSDLMEADQQAMTEKVEKWRAEVKSWEVTKKHAK